jgi:hypothetical protein
MVLTTDDLDAIEALLNSVLTDVNDKLFAITNVIINSSYGNEAINTKIANIQSRIPATLVSGRMDASVGAMVAGVNAQIADSVLDELLSEHIVSGSLSAGISSLITSVALISSGSAQAPVVPSLGNLVYYNNEEGVIKTLNTPNYTALDIKVCIELPDKTDVATVPNANLTKTSTSIGFAMPAQLLSVIGTYKAAIRKTSNNELLGTATIHGYYAPHTS